MKKLTLILACAVFASYGLASAATVSVESSTGQIRSLQVNTPGVTIEATKNVGAGTGSVNVGGVLNVQNQASPASGVGGTVVTPGRTINVQDSLTGQKSVDINTGVGAGLNVVSPSVGAVDVNNYGAKIRIENGPNGATVVTPGASVVTGKSLETGAEVVKIEGLNIKTSGGAGTVTIIRDDSGKTINISPASGKLERQINIVASDPEAKQAMVRLGGNSQILIQDSGDLGEYAKLVVSARPSVTNIDLDGSRLTVQYNQPAKFLGIFSTEIDAKAIVDAEKGVTVSLPWYGFLFRKNVRNIKSAIVSGIASDQKAAATISAEADQDSQALTVQQQARTINVVTSAVDSGGSSVSVGAGVSVVSDGSSVEVSQ